MKSLFLNLLLFPVLVVAQNQMDVTDFAASITAKELKENLYVYASDYFQGLVSIFLPLRLGVGAERS